MLPDPGWLHAPWRPPLARTARCDAEGRCSPALLPGVARPLTCGGRPEGRGRGGPGQQQGAPPGQPIPASRAATRGGGGGGTGAQLAPSRCTLRPLPPPALRLPPSFRAPIATFHPLPARAASFLPPLLPLSFPVRGSARRGRLRLRLADGAAARAREGSHVGRRQPREASDLERLQKATDARGEARRTGQGETREPHRLLKEGGRRGLFTDPSSN